MMSFIMSLVDLDTRMQAMGGQWIATFCLPETEQEAHNLAFGYLREISCDTEQMTAYRVHNEHKLMEVQLGVYNTIISSIEDEKGDLIFIDTPDGTGKTVNINLLLAKLRQMKHITLAVASRGIAATLLSDVLAAHSCFKNSLNLSKKKATCNISRGSIKHKFLSGCKLII